ncbi:SCO family protein [Anoxybacillus geothermalis]|uniref:Cytochrome c oxidase assembly protein n=1 Tax=Parageobacillus galactosidasius TaxID=883812 RepID=A0A226QPM5_9BACL|nr:MULTISPECIES: SCO family protein [Parageobacillus]MED0654691.1 SCO family protein [Anoxybacillus geothermalis]PDM38966.1 SCO family protein [Parageobacillus yumthangensis]TXK89878.1 SCO family protein [Parageobacillus sp. SY1]WJQ01834.1 SCO family protein [Geobacillus stearothermophilus]OXB94315.1 cytochrome c oxidase assembly protein [Parageobacillus galactosidasius]
MKRMLLLLSIVLLAACGKTIPDAKNWPVDDFTFTDQNGQSFGLSDLKGKVWVADFIFTNCETVCPPMTANMAKLQDMVKEEGLDVEFVSFSVDPEVDTPEKLKEYAKKFNADLSNWHFLTGYSQEEIETFARKNFKAIVQKPKQGDQVIHGTDFYLVDQQGKIVKYYSGISNVPYEEIIKHIKALQ